MSTKLKGVCCLSIPVVLISVQFRFSRSLSSCLLSVLYLLMAFLAPASRGFKIFGMSGLSP